MIRTLIDIMLKENNLWVFRCLVCGTLSGSYSLLGDLYMVLGGHLLTNGHVESQHLWRKKT